MPAAPAADPESLARAAFARHFDGRPAVLARAPGRVELLGNHTDYNDGLVLSAAVDRTTVVVGRAVGGRSGRIASANLDGIDAADLDALRGDDPEGLPRGEEGSWARYVRGVAWALQGEYGPFAAGYEAALAGDVPLGAGLSSSASLQAALALFYLGAGVAGEGAPGLPPTDADRMRLAHALRRSENRFVGVGSGLLDQFSALFGREGHGLVLDCATLEYDRVPLGTPAPAIVVCDSRTSRRLAEGQYNRRVEECGRVVAAFGVRSLREIDPDELLARWDGLDPAGRRRARHVLTENERVRRGAESLRRGDPAGFGRLMSESHASSRDDFENSSPALDALIEAAEASQGYLGGKLSGAGWAGCTVNLVESSRADGFAESVREGYARRTGTEPFVHACRAAEGAAVAPAS